MAEPRIPMVNYKKKFFPFKFKCYCSYINSVDYRINPSQKFQKQKLKVFQPAET